MLLALRRWLPRHPARWVLCVALGLTLGSAQIVAACHEISHGLVHHEGTVSGTADLGWDGSKRTHPASVAGEHDCPLCLLAAALGGVATAPQGPTLPAADGLATAPHAVAHAFSPRLACAYASRAPPPNSPAA
jgi:hypothetical protein